MNSPIILLSLVVYISEAYIDYKIQWYIDLMTLSSSNEYSTLLVRKLLDFLKIPFLYYFCISGEIVSKICCL